MTGPPSATPPRLYVLTPDTCDASRVGELARICKTVADARPSARLGFVVRVAPEHLDSSARAAAKELAESHVQLTVKVAGDALSVDMALALARDVGAAAVHLGSREGRFDDVLRALDAFEGRVSVAIHRDEESMHLARILEPRDAGRVDAFVSPVFATPGKGDPRGAPALSAARAAFAASGAGAGMQARVIALGGIDLARAAECFAAGADAIAVIRSVSAAVDPVAALRALAAV